MQWNKPEKLLYFFLLSIQFMYTICKSKSKCLSPKDSVITAMTATINTLQHNTINSSEYLLCLLICCTYDTSHYQIV